MYSIVSREQSIYRSPKIIGVIRWSIFLLGMFPPIPRIYGGGVNEIQAIVALLLLLVAGSYILIRHGQVYPIPSVLMVVFFVFPLVFSIVGVAKGNSFVSIAKEFVFFSIPLFCTFTFINLRISFSHLLGALTVTAVFASLAQCAYGATAILDPSINRYHYRWDYLLMSSDLIALGVFAECAKAQKLRHLLSFKMFILLVGMASTLGRFELMTLLIPVVFLSILNLKQFRILHVIGVACLGALPIAYSLSILTFNSEITDTSTLWRATEWLSYMRHAEGSSMESILFGEGFGAFLKSTITLKIATGEEFDLLDRFHNFWLYLIFKTGLVGAILFACCLFFLISFKARASSQSQAVRYYYFGLLYVLFSFFVKGNIVGLITMDISDGVLLSIWMAIALHFRPENHATNY